MRIIRASEIGTYRFCNRAWWYQLQGYVPDNLPALQKGTEYHLKHSYTVTSLRCLQVLAYSLVLLAVVSGMIWLIQTYL
jgi:hypothetical protein